MTIVSAIGVVATPRGLIQQYDLAGTPSPWTLPAAAFRDLQAGPVPVLVDHDEGFVAGTVVALVRSRADGLLAVLRLDGPAVDLLDDGDWYLSPGIRTRAGSRPLERAEARLDEVSLTRDPATLGVRPLCWTHTDITTDGGGQPHGLTPSQRTAWDRAHRALQHPPYRRSDRLWIVDLDPLPVAAPKATPPAPARTRAAHRPPPGPHLHYYGRELHGAAAQAVLDRLAERGLIAPPTQGQARADTAGAGRSRVYRHRVAGALTLVD